MSHELPTPLNAILGYSEFLCDDAKELSSDHQLFATSIHQSAEHLLSLVNDVLDLARIEAGKGRVYPEAIDYPQVIDQCVASVSALSSNKAIEVECSIDAGLGEGVSDPRLVSQILLNYLSNANKFTPEGGSIRVAASVLGNAEYRIDVSDTGRGIPATDLEQLFTEFAPLHGSTHVLGGSTGLGLWLTKRIAESMGGVLKSRASSVPAARFRSSYRCA